MEYSVKSGALLDIQVTTDGLVVDYEGAIGVLQGAVGCQDRVVRVNAEALRGSCCRV